jgi:hypothetical protein
MVCSEFINAAKNAIVQMDQGERLGDRLLIISAVQYFALKNGLDFYYYPSSLLDKFTLSIYNNQFNQNVKACYKHIVTFNEATCNQAAPSTLFMAPWSVIDAFCLNFNKRHLQRDLFEHLQTMLTPLIDVPKLDIPDGYVSVAAHIRKGDGYDAPLRSAQIYKNVDPIFWGDNHQSQKQHRRASDDEWPNKFPPEQYYIDQINFLADLLADEQIICFIFSDSHDPEALTRRIAHHCNRKNINFVNATSDKSDSPIIDMRRIASCECLIRAQSAYSIVAQIMGNHKIVISPKACAWHSDFLHVSQTSCLLFNSIKNDAMECTLEHCNPQILKKWIEELFPSDTYTTSYGI